MDELYILIAEAHAQSEIDEGVKRAVEGLPKQPLNFDGLCVDCDEELLPARLKFGAITCVPCQTLRERRASLMRKQP